jgi:hypothetical protein
MDDKAKAARNESRTALVTLKTLAAELLIAQDPRISGDAVAKALAMIFNHALAHEDISRLLAAARARAGIATDTRGRAVGAVPHASLPAGVIAAVRGAIHEEARRLNLKTSGLRVSGEPPHGASVPPVIPQPAPMAPPPVAAPVKPPEAKPPPPPPVPTPEQRRDGIVEAAIRGALSAGAKVEIAPDGKVTIIP